MRMRGRRTRIRRDRLWKGDDGDNNSDHDEHDDDVMLVLAIMRGR